MKRFFFIITLSLFFLANAYAQNSDWKNFAIENKIPLDQIHPSHIPRDPNQKDEKIAELFYALKELPPDKLNNFFSLDYVPPKEGLEPVQMTIDDPSKFFRAAETNDKASKFAITIRKKDGKSVKMNLSLSAISSYLISYSQHIAKDGDIQNLKPDPIKKKEKHEEVLVKEEEKVVHPDPKVAPKFDCQGELTKALSDYFKENREDFIKTQYRITSLKLAQKTKNSQKNNLEEMLKADKSQLDHIKNSQESMTKLKNLYRAYGFEEDSKAIEEVEKLSNKSSSLSYYKSPKRLLNEDLSAYIMANVADSKNTLFDESDAATAWLFDEMQKQYLKMGNEKFSSQFNLMNLSSSAFLISNGKENSPEEISKQLLESENNMAQSYQEFLVKFKDEKKQCFEKGEGFENACDEDLLSMIEKGFSTDLKGLIKEMQSDSIKPEFDVGHLKLADSKIAFEDLITSDISNLERKEITKKSSSPSKEETKKTKKNVSANSFTNEIYKKITTSSPLLSKKKMKNNYFTSNDYNTVIGNCKVNVFRLNNGKTRVEMFSPVNKMSYNLTISTNIFSPSATDYAVAQALDKNYNKPHIRNSCLAN